MTEPTTIRIDLDLVGNPDTAPNSPSFIQREARARVLEALTRPVEVPPEDAESGDRPPALNVLRERRHDAILVSARRGEGKTTFLASILASIQNDSYRHLLERSAASTDAIPRLYSLGMIDPTLIETKQNIIIVIIDRIRIATEHRRLRSGREADYVPVEDSLRRLAQGLSLLDGIGEGLYSKDWVDPDFVLDRGLEEASAAHDFERRFRGFVRAAARYLDADAFVLAIDDVDTWFERGWPVLEALRKYLVTPQLRIILSGDLNLYALLVRRQQWGQMGDDFLKAEQLRESAEPGTSLIGKIGSMVEALQDQYLVKVTPPENRVDLKPLAYHAENARIELSAKELNKAVRIDEFVRTVSDRVFSIRHRSDLELVARQLLQLPTRSALQLLAGSVSVCRDTPPNKQALSAAENALRHVAWTALMSLGLEIEKTRDPAPGVVMGILGEWLTRSKLWNLARFHPDAVDADNKNLVALYITTVLSGVFRASPGRMIEFWLKIAIIREKVDRGEIGEGTSGGMPDLFAHLAAARAESGVQFVSRLAAWEMVEVGQRSRRPVPQIRMSGASVPLGRIREEDAASRELYGLDTKDKTTALDRELFREIGTRSESDRQKLLGALPPPLRAYHAALIDAGWSYDSKRRKEAGFQNLFASGIESLANRMDRNAKIVALIPVHRIVSGQAAEFGNYSFLRLLGVIGELVDLIPASESQRTVEIGRILRSATQVRSYPTPFAAQDTRPEPPEYTHGEEDDTETGLDPFADHAGWRIEEVLENWLEEHAQRQVERPLSPVTLSRMWTRFTYTFQNMRDELVHRETRYLGVLMHRTVIAFLHSIGFEAMRGADVAASRSLANNPVSSGEVFARLLSEIYGEDRKAAFEATPEYQFFDMLFSCPLWAYFLARHEELEVREQRRAKPNENIWGHYIARTKPFWPESAASLASVELHSLKSEPSIDFEGLFVPLNIVQLQGQKEQSTRAGQDLAAAQRALRNSQSSPRKRIRLAKPAADESEKLDETGQ